MSETGNTAASRKQSNNGKVGNHGVEDGGSGHLKESGREGDAGRRSKADGVPRAYATIMEYQVQEDHAGAAAETRQLVAQNYVTGSGEVDSSGVAQGLQFSYLGRGHGDIGRKACRR